MISIFSSEETFEVMDDEGAIFCWRTNLLSPG